MIYMLKGTICIKDKDTVVVDVHSLTLTFITFILHLNLLCVFLIKFNHK